MPIISTTPIVRDNLDKVRGCLIGGAMGDALGYAVEFLRRDEILKRFGEKGITRFELSPEGKALVSDDTQMTLFTANALLSGATSMKMNGGSWPMLGKGKYPSQMHPEILVSSPGNSVARGYVDWYKTQGGYVTQEPSTWLRDLPQMQHRRAPGNTCISACSVLAVDRSVKNDSKGCGGLMRVAPFGLFGALNYDFMRLYGGIMNMYGDIIWSTEGAQSARVTHRHPLGFLPAALLTSLLKSLSSSYHTPTHIITFDICRSKRPVPELEKSLSTLHAVFPGKYLQEKAQLEALTRKAMELAEKDIPDAEAIAQLGEGWTADEAWAIAIYCALRHRDDPQAALIAAVNHDGDSDSTGSICGNIIGAMHGYKALCEGNILCPEGKTLEQTLELHDIILALADDLSRGCLLEKDDPLDTPEKQQWHQRYCLNQPAGLNPEVADQDGLLNG